MLRVILVVAGFKVFLNGGGRWEGLLSPQEKRRNLHARTGWISITIIAVSVMVLSKRTRNETVGGSFGRNAPGRHDYGMIEGHRLIRKRDDDWVTDGLRKRSGWLQIRKGSKRTRDHQSVHTVVGYVGAAACHER